MTIAQTLITFETHWYDVVVLVVLIIGLWSGMRAGFSREALRAAGLVLGVIIGMDRYAAAGQWLTRYSGLVPERANLAMFVAIVLGVHLIFGFARLAVERWTQDRPLPASLENLGGAVAGLVRMWAFMVAVSVSFCLLQSEFWHEQIGRESRFGRWVVQQFPDLEPVVQKREVETVWFLRNKKRGPQAVIKETGPEKPQKPGLSTPQEH
jgi:uncharacterized membrane protein required for colicin V production